MIGIKKQSQLDPTNKNFKPLYQPSGRNLSRMRRKAMSKQNWFKPKDIKEEMTKRSLKKKSFHKDGKCSRKIETTTVMFVQNTKGGHLIGKLKEKENMLAQLTGFRVKYQESAGTQLGKMFDTNTAKDQPCGRLSCYTCEASKEGQTKVCKSRGIVYESSCVECNPESEEGNLGGLSSQVENDVLTSPVQSSQQEMNGRIGIYIGESSRSLYERVHEHMKDARKFTEKSHIIKHWMNTHPELENQPAFKFRILKVHKDCLSRQLGEAVTIWLSKDSLLNSKNEYLSNCITRITVNEEVAERKVREAREEEEERKEKEKLNEFRKNKMPSACLLISTPQKRKHETQNTETTKGGRILKKIKMGGGGPILEESGVNFKTKNVSTNLESNQEKPTTPDAAAKDRI